MNAPTNSSGSTNAKPSTEGKFCPLPWTHLELRKNLDLGLCTCPGWVPEPIGTLQTDESILSQFNSEKARKIRRTILDGTFAYCNQNACPYLLLGTLPRRNDILTKKQLFWNGTNVAAPEYKAILRQDSLIAPKPRFYQLCYDETCNLSCPSCRSGIVSIQSGEIYAKKQAAQEKFYREILAEPITQWTLISMCGTGDPFASRLFRQLLQRIDGNRHRQLWINFQTNGQLFTPRLWEGMPNIHGNVLDILVSMDAARKTTYEVVRRGGDWDTLLGNLQFISSLRQRRTFRGLFRLDFVVQQRNFREMADFIGIAKGLKADVIQFHAVQSYLENSEMTPERGYHEHAVWLSDHPEHAEFLAVLANPAFADPRVNLGGLTPLRSPGYGVAAKPMTARFATSSFEAMNRIAALSRRIARRFAG